ncbi:MAG: hypothetical protein HQM04_15305 [Magnetococcales bacterium]|nr:hypothetical protein [Magnetococcales bacterium]MBF0116393.1 hypothetical protein [Magnetococcales bacterium]
MDANGIEKAGGNGKQQFWLEHWQRCQAASGTIKAYAETHGLSLAAMYWWRRELIDRGMLEGSPRRARFKKLIVSSDPTPTPFRILFPNGAVVEWMDGRMERVEALLRLVASLS